MRRILYFNPADIIGGSEISLLELLSKLDRKAFHPVVLAPDDGPFLAAVSKLDIETRVIPFPKSFKEAGKRGWSPRNLKNIVWLWQVPKVVKRIMHFLNDEEIDLIHTNGVKAHFLGGAAARLERCPIVWHVREALYPGKISDYLRKLSCEWPNKIICNSGFTAGELPEKAPVKVVHNGVDITRFKPMNTRESVLRELNIPFESKVLGMVGHLAPVKGQEQFIRMVALLKKEIPDIKALIVGTEAYKSTGDYIGVLKELVSQLGLEHNIIFMAFREDVPEIINAVDVFVVPSLMEGFGRTALEAMACGAAVVGTSVGGVPEIIVNGETGLLVEPDSPEGLAEGVMRVLRDASLREKIQHAGIKRAHEKFSVDFMVKSIENVYYEILNR